MSGRSHEESVVGVGEKEGKLFADLYQKYEEYLGILSVEMNGFFEWLQGLMVHLPRLIDRFNGTKKPGGFEVIQMTDGPHGTAGPAGNFSAIVWKERLVRGGENKVEEDSLAGQLGRLFDWVEKNKNVPMVPNINYQYQDESFPRRMSKDPKVRVVFPKMENNKMVAVFVDLTLSQAKEMLRRNKLIDLLLGELEMDGLPMNVWYQQKEGEEPPIISISAKPYFQDSLLALNNKVNPFKRFGDPRLLANLHFILNPKGGAVLGLWGEFGHVPIDGVGAIEMLQELGYSFSVDEKNLMWQICKKL